MSLTNAKPVAGCGNHGSRLHGAGFGPPGLIRDFPEGTSLGQRKQMFHDRNKQEAENASECIQQDIVNIELPDSQPVLQRFNRETEDHGIDDELRQFAVSSEQQRKEKSERQENQDIAQGVMDNDTHIVTVGSRQIFHRIMKRDEVRIQL